APGVALLHAHEQAARAAGPAEVAEPDARDLGEGDREQREIHAGDAEAEGEKADHEAEHHAQRDRKPHAGPRSDAVVEEERPRRVRADADVERVPERELAGEA